MPLHSPSPLHDDQAATSDAVVRTLPSQSASSRPPILRSSDRSRWSDSYSRSRSSSLVNGLSSNQAHEINAPHLSQKPSYDLSWQTVDEKDEGVLSEEETDDEPNLDANYVYSDEKHEERTSAAVIADEGRGLIVQGDNMPVVQLQVQAGPSLPNSLVLLPAHPSL